MEYRQLQHSELTLSAIAFGAWAAGGWMWGQTDRHEAIKAMRAAYAEGMSTAKIIRGKISISINMPEKRVLYRNVKIA